MAEVLDDIDALKLKLSSLLRQFSKGSKTSNGLQSLLDATHNVHIAINQSSFRQRQDAARLLNNVREICKLAFSNLQNLQFLIDPDRDRTTYGRSPVSEHEETARNQAIFQNLNKHASQFQSICDIIANREDWSRLAPKPTRAPSASPDSALRLKPVDSNKATISMPASPYQPSVEEIDDTDAEDAVRSNVEHVHYVHKDESPITPTDKFAAGMAHRRGMIPQTPPQVVIRQATDPKQFSDSTPPLKTSSVSASPLRTAAGADDTSDDSDNGSKDPLEPQLRSSTLPKIVTKTPSKTIQDLQDEINRLQSQIDKFAKSSEDNASDSSRTESNKANVKKLEMSYRKTSGKHRSVDLGRTDSLSATDTRRPRASTSQGGDRPKSFVEGSSYDPYGGMPPPARPDKLKRTTSQRSARGPSRSPRATPYSAFERTEYSWDYPSADPVPQSAAEMYGPGPRSSLPTLLERDSRSGRPSSRLPHRKSNTDRFEDPRDNFRDFFEDDTGASDFPLFPSAGPGPSMRQPRSRGNSRAQDTSPNSKPYISPRQLHADNDLEPDVREISISLEDVFWGTTKKYKIKRDKYNASTGIITTEEKLLEVPISRGLKPKSKIKFAGEGHQCREGTRELHFQLAEKPHDRFTRVDYDLHITLEISLVESLCGWERLITSIDGKEVRFSHPGPTPASWRDDRAGLGMCLFKNPEQRGDLIASIKIREQGPLTEAQKRMIRQAFGIGVSPRSSGNFF